MIDIYCVDPITIVRHASYDALNQPVIESDMEVLFRAYVVWKKSLVRNAKGEEVVTTVMLYIPDVVEVALGRALTHEDRILLEGETTDRAIIEIHRPKDFSNPHYEVYLA